MRAGFSETILDKSKPILYFFTVQEKLIPSPLHTAETIADRLQKKHCPVTAKRLTELADAGFIPCCRWNVDGEQGPPLFLYDDVEYWAAKNWFRQQEGIPFPKDLTVLCPIIEPHVHLANEGIPTPLLPLEGKLYFVNSALLIGVYFLVESDEVVYVGQSVNTTSRIRSHLSENQKRFDRSFMMPVPETELDAIEGAFIRALKPKYNSSHGLGAPACDESIIIHYAPDLARRVFGPDAHKRSSHPWPPQKYIVTDKKTEDTRKDSVTCWFCQFLSCVRHLVWNRSNLGRCPQCGTVLAVNSHPQGTFLTEPKDKNNTTNNSD